jgi:hypothetical protein
MSGEYFPFDFTQYCVTEEPMAGQAVTDIDIYPGEGEQYIGIYNFNPGFPGTITIITAKASIDWTNPDASTLKGEVRLKAKKYTDAGWSVIDTYSFDGTTDVLGTATLSKTMELGDGGVIDYLYTVPWFLCTTCELVGADIEFGSELIGDPYFLSGETYWTLDEDTSYSYIDAEGFVYLRNPVTNPIATNVGVISGNFSVTVDKRYKIEVELPERTEEPGDPNYQEGTINGQTFDFRIKRVSDNATIHAERLLAFSKKDIIYTRYYTALATESVYIRVQKEPYYGMYGIEDNYSYRLKSTYVSVKEVTQEPTAPTDTAVTFTPGAVIVRCLGETY